MILECIGFAVAFETNGLRLFVFYTQLSNLVLLIASVAYIRLERLAIKNQTVNIAVSMVTLTYIVVMFVLAPMASSDGRAAVMHVISGGSSLYHHLLCPILAIVSFLLLEEGKFDKKQVNIALAPTLVYTIIAVVLNMIKVIEGPYPFLMVTKQPIWASFLWFVVIVGAGYGIALLLGKLKK